MKAWKHRGVWFAVIACLAIIAGDWFLLCPHSWFSSKWSGSGYWGAKPRVLIAVSRTDGALAVSIRDHGTVRVYTDYQDRSLRPISEGVFDADPAWDSSYARLAYVSFGTDGQTVLRIADLRDGSDKAVLKEPLMCQPLWCQDGRSMLFMKNRLNMRSILCSLDLATGTVTPIAKTPVIKPQAWTLLADGDRIAYINYGSVWLKSMRGGTEQRLPIDVGVPCTVAGSPDGRFLFVCDRLSIEEKRGLLVDLETYEVEIVAERYIRYAWWSPSGKRLAIANRFDTDVFEVSLSSKCGSRVRYVTTLKGIGVCWRSDSSLVLIRPDMVTPHRLEEIDLVSGSSVTLYPEAAESESGK